MRAMNVNRKTFKNNFAKLKGGFTLSFHYKNGERIFHLTVIADNTHNLFFLSLLRVSQKLYNSVEYSVV